MTAAPVSVLMYDETPGYGRSPAVKLELVSERITVRQLIESRVRREVDEINRAPAHEFRTLVQPSDAERTLNGFRLRTPKRIDADAQCALAFDAFEHNRFFLLVDDRQVERLDEEIVIGRDTEVGFFKLVPLVGG
ncbi:MAG TPA: hypothetical protein VN903_06465 [Polyangia bacterium]|jgi:hypothetical protein|nr:hypothetical protein [Polyangia bacterium]